LGYGFHLMASRVSDVCLAICREGAVKVVRVVGLGLAALMFLVSVVNLLGTGLVLAQTGSDSSSLGRFMGQLLVTVVMLVVLKRLWKWRPTR
jgi:membrane protein YdbS with pleckstrin-like domain